MLAFIRLTLMSGSLYVDSQEKLVIYMIFMFRCRVFYTFTPGFYNSTINFSYCIHAYCNGTRMFKWCTPFLYTKVRTFL